MDKESTKSVLVGETHPVALFVCNNDHVVLPADDENGAPVVRTSSASDCGGETRRFCFLLDLNSKKKKKECRYYVKCLTNGLYLTVKGTRIYFCEGVS